MRLPFLSQLGWRGADALATEVAPVGSLSLATKPGQAGLGCGQAAQAAFVARSAPKPRL